jgi:DNA mismatch repair protein MutL
MIAIDWEALDLRISGLISRPDASRSRRDREYFFVNGRPIRAGLLAVMLERPYAGLLPPGRYPIAVISIAVDPAFVDVNVHPQKAEVRFSRERSIYGALSQAINRALSDFPRQEFVDDTLFNWPFASVAGSVESESQLSLHEGSAAYQTGPLHPLTQIHQTYILAQSAEGLLIIDQHTAHEQILYERLTSSRVDQAHVGPFQLALSRTEMTLLSAHLPLFGTLGFELEPFGRQAFVLRTIPALLQPHLPNQVARSNQPLEAVLLTTLLEELQAHQSLDPEAQRDKVAQKAACVCAVKAGDLLSTETMRQLLHDLVETWSPAACPHGRPIFVSLSLEEIERRFGRR